MKTLRITCVIVALSVATAVSAQSWYSEEAALQAERLLSEMTVEEKLDFISGDWMYSCPVSRLGIDSIKMSDGPQGLGTHGPSTAYPSTVLLTATWNRALAYRYGESLASDCHARGVNMLLGPAVNIHRNPLCGRNYEYFSEDPLVSGKCAAAIIRGVESHKGCYAVIKHFAANNRETARSLSNSIVDERTLREIYLKPFAIAIREGKPHGVMTSYNRLNGTYTANSYALCTTILRKEWGYQGVVMSDWFSIGLGHARHGKAIHAGNDLIMPGNKADVILLKNDYQRGVFTKEELETSCLRILDAILKSQRQKLSQK